MTTILVMARSQLQFEFFVQNQHLDPDRVKRVSDVDDVRGQPAGVLYLLPDSDEGICAHEVVQFWIRQHNCSTRWLSEEVCLGVAPFTPEGGAS